MSEYLVALGLTLLVELPVYAGVLRAFGVPVRRALAAGLVANLLTHPLLWLGLGVVLRPFASGPGYAIAFVAGEALVCAVEALVLVVLLRRYEVGAVRLGGVSVLANALSAGLGLVLALLR